jgi:hypothetical protein
MAYFNVISFVVSQQIAAREGITDPQRQNFYGLLGGVMGNQPIGLGVTLALANQEAQQTVTALPPGLTSIVPASGNPGASLQVTLTGLNFRVNARVTTDNPAVTVSNVQVTSDRQITATLAIAQNAQGGNVNVRVSTNGGQSQAIAFAIAAGLPVVTSINPTGATVGATVPVTITGSNLTGASAINIAAPSVGVGGNVGVTASNLQVVSPTQLTATFTVPQNATPGTLNVTVTTPVGTSTPPVPFSVAAIPTLSSINPSVGDAGANVSVTLTGTNFISPATINVSDTAVSVNQVTVVSPTQITAVFAIGSGAKTGTDANVTVTTPGGTSGGAAFTITDPNA